MAVVPEQREHAAGTKHARYLRDRGVVGEPVERLAGEHAVDLAVRERDLLRGARAHVRFGNALREDRAQLVERLDGDDVRVPVRKRAGELARAGAEVEHSRVVADRQQVEDARRPAGPPTVVLGRRAVETARLLAQLTPARRNARFSFSISRAITSRCTWFVPS